MNTFERSIRKLDRMIEDLAADKLRLQEEIRELKDIIKKRDVELATMTLKLVKSEALLSAQQVTLDIQIRRGDDYKKLCDELVERMKNNSLI